MRWYGKWLGVILTSAMGLVACGPQAQPTPPILAGQTPPATPASAAASPRPSDSPASIPPPIALRSPYPGRALPSGSGPRRPAVPVVTPRLPTITRMAWANAQTGYLVTGAIIDRTRNGGKSWAVWYHAAHALRQPLVGPAGALWVRSGSWLRQLSGSVRGHVQASIPLPVPGMLRALAVRGPEVWGLTSGRIVRWNRSTHHWVTVSGSVGPVDAMVWCSPDVAFAAVGPSVWRTTSGGRTWTRVFTAPVHGSAWQSQLVANSRNRLWFLVSGGVGGMGQVGFVLWEGTAEGTRWTAITDEGYWAPSGYPSVHPMLSTAIMRPGPLTAVGPRSVDWAGWTANGGGHWVIVTNESGHWQSVSTRPRSPAPDIFHPPIVLAFATPRTGYLAGTAPNGGGAILRTTNGGRTWRSWTPTLRP